jgi:hypothetical protein
MSQPVLSVLSHQQELVEAARRRIAGDANESNLMVGKVISRALEKLSIDAQAAISGPALLRDLDAVIGETRAGRPS